MNLVIVHHHLNPGGVTGVVRNHVRALQSVATAPVSRILILHGGCRSGWPEDDSRQADKDQPQSQLPVQLVVVPGLDYDDRTQLHCEALSAAILKALTATGCEPQQTIVHAHNHSLGKHVSLPGALRLLAEQGYRLLLQIHDFAEDLRPGNYERFVQATGADHDPQAVGRYLYPSGGHIHYALLNSRDQQVFLSTGLDRARVHLLPNPVTSFATLPPHEESRGHFQDTFGLDRSQQLVLYPVRAIRRKNIGELLLWSAVCDRPLVFAVTLPATSSNESPSYQRWRALAQRLQLPVLFDVGLNEGITYEQLLAGAGRIITTSIAEGFGLVFLESWLNGKMLIGRDLPEITKDFVARGVRLDHLGRAVEIPLDWLGLDAYLARTLDLHQQLCAAYGIPMPSGAAAALREAVASGHVDFAALPTSMQVQVIERVAGERTAANQVLQRNAWLRTALAEDDAACRDLVASNAAAVGAGFSLQSTAADLTNTYAALIASRTDGPVTAIDMPENILEAFLDIRRLHPVRFEP